MSHPIGLPKVWWPATTCALVFLVMSILIAPLDLEYDDNGIGSLLFLINSVVGFFFLTAGDVLYSLNGNQWLPYHSAYTVLLGFPFYVLCDLLLRCVARRLGKWVDSTVEGGKAKA